jgi:hypothetical protein
VWLPFSSEPFVFPSWAPAAAGEGAGIGSPLGFFKEIKTEKRRKSAKYYHILKLFEKFILVSLVP